jgi:subtilisin family serine protease
MNRPKRTVAFAALSVAAALLTAAAPAVASASSTPTGGQSLTSKTVDTTAAADTTKAAATVIDPTKTQRYLVQLKDAPVATYDGDIKGLAATKPAKGKRLKATSTTAKAYRSHLNSQHSTVLKKVGVTSKQTGATLTTAFNGFIATLTPAQADQMRATSGVTAIYADRQVKAETWHTPEFLGLSGQDGAWQKQFGGTAKAGAGVIIGDLDTGFWPESKSFDALPEPRPDATAIAAKWKGVCDVGTDNPVTCNNKVIGARWYDGDGSAELSGTEFHSPRDRNGHGTHTASTAAGDYGVPASIGDQDLGTISGMAPAARIAVYKVLYDNGAGEAFGSQLDIVNAIDDAVADGVDVINYSVGDDDEAINPVDLAFFNAAAAGVFISASAGNAGPDASTVDNSTPWVTTVAASTQDREFQRTLTLGDGTELEGIGMGSTAVASAPLVDSEAVALDPDDTYSAGLCDTGSLDPAKVKGTIVFCLRGVIDRVAKSKTVLDAGGVGMVLYNDVTNSLNADLHSVPTVHIDDVQAPKVAAYIAKGDAAASISASKLAAVDAPQIAGFSSTGPSILNNSDLLKPDISAPGVDIAASTSPAQAGASFALMSGTSMAAPHVSGIAALIVAKHPDWSPAEVRSAMMTTAQDTTVAGKEIQVGTEDATPFNYGAGEVHPATAFDPGLVFDSNSTDWVQYLCGIYPDGISYFGGYVDLDCATTGTLATNQLNYPSIAMGQMVGTQTVTRTVTNVGTKASHYVSEVKAPAGYTVKVTPAAITINPGKTASFKVQVTNVSAAFNTWSDGKLTWEDQNGHVVGMPLVLKNSGLIAPDSITGTTTTGTAPIQAQVGYKGTLKSDIYGLTAGTSTQSTLTGQRPPWDWSNLNNLPSPLPASLGVQKIHVPAGSVQPQVYITSDLLSCAGSDGEDDAPPCVEYSVDIYGTDGAFVNDTVAGKKGAKLDLPDGEADYTVVIEQEYMNHVDNPTQASVTYTTTLYTPGATGSSTGKLTIDPKNRTVVAGATANLTVRWSGLTAGTRYIGVLNIGNGKDVLKTVPITVTP